MGEASKFLDFHNHGDIALSSLKLITGRATPSGLHDPHITPSRMMQFILPTKCAFGGGMIFWPNLYMLSAYLKCKL